MAEMTIANSKMTHDNNSPHHAGNHFIVTGTLVPGDANVNYFRAAPSTGAVLYCHVENQTYEDTTVGVRINASDFSTASQGNVTFQGTVADTYRFTAGIIL